MDYTTAARVKAHLRISGNGDDALLSVLATAASRAVDRKCAGSQAQDVEDYFALETVTDEEIRALAGGDGVLKCWPRKPVIASVSALAYRGSPLESWTTIETDRIQIEGEMVAAWPAATLLAGPRRVKLTYIGGYAASVDDLPADLVEAVTVLTARYYREAESGITDIIGIVEIGKLKYTKAIPERVVDMLAPYIRRIPW